MILSENPVVETTVLRVACATVDGLRHLSTDEFRRFGLPVLAYLRKLPPPMAEGEYALHAADGTPLAVVEDLDTALALADHSAMILVSLQ